MKAEVITVGTELLLGEIVDTNSAYLARLLNDCGIDLYYMSSAGDNWERFASVLKTALDRVDLIITTGGLGPTTDDITKEVVAEIFGEELVLDKESLVNIEKFFMKRHRVMSLNNRKQAIIPKSAIVVPNPAGTAPGIILSKNGKTVICLPGVPLEIRAMVENTVMPYLKKISGASITIRSKVLRLCNIGESALEERIRDLIDEQNNPTIAPLAKTGEVFIRITAKGDPDEVDGMIEETEKKLRTCVGEFIYGCGEDELEKMVGEILKERKLKLGVAESCTGGLISNRLTNIPGSSEYFDCGLVTYSNAAKMRLLGVSNGILDAFGAVSAETARAMAEGLLKNHNVDIGLSVTGLAGPDGGEEGKPVGLVYIGLVAEGFVTHVEYRFASNRIVNKESAANLGLQLLYRYLTGKLEGES